MDVIDTHCHVSPVWFEPVETLLFHMDRHGVSHAILTQLLGQTDNDYQLQCVARYPGRFTCVVAVDPEARDVANHLRALVAAGARGLRMRADTRAVGADPYLLWRTAAEEGLSVSCVGPAATFLTPQFGAVLAAFPGVNVLAEHLGGWGRPDCDGSEVTLEGIKSLARFPNLHLKVPPLGQLVKRGPRLPPSGRTLELAPAGIVLDLLRIYGAERLCWASDFPVVSSREGYANALAWSLELFGQTSTSVREQVFAGNARRIFRVGR
ncbi:MAG TPA: amidohydrolase family protein [Steroidobacteraceae bacterium]|nr:amidohydrolase family protein [Steroidobacteraceae bacterium]